MNQFKQFISSRDFESTYPIDEDVFDTYLRASVVVEECSRFDDVDVMMRRCVDASELLYNERFIVTETDYNTDSFNEFVDIYEKILTGETDDQRDQLFVF